MKNEKILVMMFLFSSLFAQEKALSMGKGGNETSYIEIWLGGGWPWDLGPSFRFKGSYGYLIDRALAF